MLGHQGSTDVYTHTHTHTHTHRHTYTHACAHTNMHTHTQGKPFAAHPASVPVVDVDSAKTTEADVLEAELPQVGTPTDKSKAAAAAAAHSSHPSRPPPLPPATTLVTQSSSTSLSPVPDTAGTAHALLVRDRVTRRKGMGSHVGKEWSHIHQKWKSME